MYFCNLLGLEALNSFIFIKKLFKFMLLISQLCVCLWGWGSQSQFSTNFISSNSEEWSGLFGLVQLS